MQPNDATTFQKITASFLGFVIIAIIVHFFYTRAINTNYNNTNYKMLGKVSKVENK